MKLGHIIYKELWQRRHESVASCIAILLGIAIIVSIQTISVSSKAKIIAEVHHLGSNILIIPAGTKVSDYYAADFGKETMPEQYVHFLHTSDFSEKVHEMIPKLSVKVDVKGKNVILTGVLPKDEFADKPEWRMNTGFLNAERKTQLITKQEGLPVVGEPEPSNGLAGQFEKLTLKYATKTKRKAFDSLGLREIMLGSESAHILGLKEDDSLEIKGRHFTVSQLLEETGTVDDIRVFAHLHTVQDIAGAGKVINAIEVVGCGCTKDLVQLGRDMEAALPGTKVITIRDIAQAQSNTIKMMKNYSWILFIIVMLIGGASIANYMFADIHERRREIGTLLAIGATPGMIVSIFLRKAVLLGLTGGVLGYMAGTGFAFMLGRYMLRVDIFPQAMFLVWSIAIAVILAVACTLIPARNAAGLDPTVILREE